MEPIKINIEVGLKESTIEALAVIFNPWKGCTCTCADTFPQPEPQPEPQPKTHPEPEAPAPVEDYDDLPPSDAQDPMPTPTEADARQAVKRARDRGVSAKVIKDYMQKAFGIASSVECPAERRADLIKGLANLAA